MFLSLKRISLCQLLCWSFLLLLLSISCSSTTLRSLRIDSKAEPGKEFGIIYQMSKPQFTITITQPSDKLSALKYTLNVEYVPDPERRYAVSVNPGTFNESDLTVNLNTNGVMIGLSEASREQVTPTIKAIGEFASPIISTAATVAGMVMLAEPKENLVIDIKTKELLKRLEVYQKSIKDIKGLSEKEKVKRKKAANDIRERLKGISKIKNYKITHLAAALKPQVQTAQIDVLKVLAKPIDKKYPPNDPKGKTPEQQADDNFKKIVEKLKEGFPDPDQRLQPIHIYVKGLLARERALVVGEVQFAIENEDLLTLLVYSDREIANTTDSGVAKIPKDDKKELKELAKDLATKARELVIARTTFPDLLGPLIKEKTLAQRIYQVAKDEQFEIDEQKLKIQERNLMLEVQQAEIEKQQAEIEKQQRLLKNEHDSAKIEEIEANIKNALLIINVNKRAIKVAESKIEAAKYKIKYLTRAFHETIGAADEYSEIIKMEKLIKNGPPQMSQAVNYSPLQEYAIARAQLAVLNEIVTLKLGRLASNASDALPAKNDPEWNPVSGEKAFCWNVCREAMEKKHESPPRILVPKEMSEEDLRADRVASRVASQYGPDISLWPKYVVVIEKVKP